MTDRELEVRHWLNRAFYADKKAKALDMLVLQCRERAEGLVRTSEGNDTSHSATPKNGTENALMKLAELEEKCLKEIEALAGIRNEIYDAIAMLHDSDLEAVLMHRYILFLTVEQTAEALNYHPNTVKKKVNKAIQNLCTKMS